MTYTGCRFWVFRPGESIPGIILGLLAGASLTGLLPLPGEVDPIRYLKRKNSIISFSFKIAILSIDFRCFPTQRIDFWNQYYRFMGLVFTFIGDFRAEKP